MVGFHFFGKYFKDEGIHPIFVEFHDTDNETKWSLQDFHIHCNWSQTVLVQCWVEPVSAGLVSLWLRNNTYYFVKDELSRLGDGGAVKIFTDVSSGGKVSRKEHSVKVTHN